MCWTEEFLGLNWRTLGAEKVLKWCGLMGAEKVWCLCLSFVWNWGGTFLLLVQWELFVNHKWPLRNLNLPQCLQTSYTKLTRQKLEKNFIILFCKHWKQFRNPKYKKTMTKNMKLTLTWKMRALLFSSFFIPSFGVVYPYRSKSSFLILTQLKIMNMFLGTF